MLFETPTPNIPPSHASQTNYSFDAGCFFVRRTRQNSAQGRSGGAGYAKKRHGPSLSARLAFPQNRPSHLTHLLPDRHRATVPPRRTIPQRNMILPPNRSTSTPYRPTHQLFEVFRRLAGLFRGATHLDLSQEVFGVLPRP
jgi:hypothetical protein